ncbi:MAG: SUMF1/EgtB/PvdO family nonheme iron enzyme [Anaerolineales bacterium]|jgi:serine/threonine-protein kinase
MSDLIGQSLGRYHILEKLGEGGMAVVYKAYDTRLERDVAVKVIRVDLFSPAALANVLQRFEREAKALANLSHPNIISVIDYGEQGGMPYLVMAYQPGGTLKELIGRPMLWKDAARLLLPIARGLAYAHQHSIAHRDVKPSNILIGESGEPMLTDFGIAKILEGGDSQTLTGTGVGLGTPEYMAPEQWTGEAGAKADIYSLGVVFYELVTGHKPYTADTPAAVLLKQATEPLPRPTQYVPDLPEKVEKVLLKALAKRPEDRYSDMKAFSLALEDLLSKQVLSQQVAPEPMTVKRASEADSLNSEEKVVTYASRLHASSDSSQPPGQKQRIWLTWRAGLVGFLVLIGAVIAVLIGQGRLVPGLAPIAPPPTYATQPTSTPTVVPTIILPTIIPTATLEIGSTQISNQDGMVLMYVPAGDFLMGSADSDTHAGTDEKPQHRVYLDAYWIDKTLVTNRMYAICVKAGACQLPSSFSSNTHPSYYNNPQYADYPVIYVTWDAANTYCNWAGRRLPTEAQWEKAARGTDGRIYPWGNSSPNSLLLNFASIVGDTTAVTSYPAGASSYGVLDMAGNVWEYVADWYSDTYYTTSPRSNPTGPSSGAERVIRGNAFYNHGIFMRSALRGATYPALSGNYDAGIRCVLVSP